MSEGFATVDDLHDKKTVFVVEANETLNRMTEEIENMIGEVVEFIDEKIEDYELI